MECEPHPQFTLTLTGDTPNNSLNAFNRVWAPTGTNTDREGFYTNYNLTLTANFAPDTVTETILSSTGSRPPWPHLGRRQLQRHIHQHRQRPGNYNVALNFNNINWAGANGIGPATVTSLQPTDPVMNIATATGGNGGQGSRATFAGVIAGPIDGISVNTTTPGSDTVSVSASQIGGNGGNGGAATLVGATGAIVVGPRHAER